MEFISTHIILALFSLYPLWTVKIQKKTLSKIYKNIKYKNAIITFIFFRDDLQTYRDIMTCSTNTYFHNLEQSLKEFIDYDLIKNLLHVSLVFIYFIKSNDTST